MSQDEVQDIMSNHATLSYSGRISVDTDNEGKIPKAEADRLHTLLDDAIAAFEGDDVTLKTAVVHFERDGGIAGDNMPRAHVEIEATGGYGELEATEDVLAQQVVDIGMEPDAEAAKDGIEVS